ncbi:hypothetical protein WBJ53_08695 [Spirosoma sp. SC4-14]|uniref:hypothetical protein n=1 Tax=Spirosoma sp. SC4-14 TaxID=3128900 RepID=UPI0030D46245
MVTQSAPQLDTSAQTLKQKRNEAIRAEYQKMFTAGKRNEFILEALSVKYFLTTDTLERIIFQRGRYKERQQRQS